MLSPKSTNPVEYLEILPDNTSQNVYEKIFYDADEVKQESRVKLEMEQKIDKSNNSKPSLSSTKETLKTIFLVLVIVAVTLLCLTFLSILLRQNCKKEEIKEKSSLDVLQQTFETELEVQFELPQNMTNRIIAKLSKALLNFPSPYGRQIRLKSTGQCLESNHYIFHECYLVLPATCNPTSPTQRFRMSKSKIQIGSQEHYPKMASHNKPCLDIHDGLADGEILVYPCHGYDMQQFTLQIYPSQIDFTNQRIHFSIISVRHPFRCITLSYLPGLKVIAFQLAQCTGSSLQSFYLSDVNFLEEVEQIRNSTQN